MIIVYFAFYLCIFIARFVRLEADLIYPILVFLLILVILTLLTLPIIVRRLHDINLSGWWILSCSILFYVLFYIKQFYIVSILGTIFLLILIFKKGTKGPNRFGEDPLERMDSIDRP